MKIFQTIMIVYTLAKIKETEMVTLSNKEIRITLHEYARSWNEAQAICEVGGGKLYVEDSTERSTVLEKYRTIWNKNDQVWIGLYYPQAGTNDIYAWTNCIWLSSYSRYKSSEPDKTDKEKCVLSHNNEWKTHKCDKNKRFVCETLGADCTFNQRTGIPAQTAEFTTVTMTTVDKSACEASCLNRLNNDVNCWGLNFDSLVVSDNCVLYFTSDPFYFTDTATYVSSTVSMSIKFCYTDALDDTDDTPVASDDNVTPTEVCSSYMEQTTTTTTTTTAAAPTTTTTAAVPPTTTTTTPPTTTTTAAAPTTSTTTSAPPTTTATTEPATTTTAAAPPTTTTTTPPTTTTTTTAPITTTTTSVPTTTTTTTAPPTTTTTTAPITTTTTTVPTTTTTTTAPTTTTATTEPATTTTAAAPPTTTTTTPPTTTTTTTAPITTTTTTAPTTTTTTTAPTTTTTTTVPTTTTTTTAPTTTTTTTAPTATTTTTTPTTTTTTTVPTTTTTVAAPTSSTTVTEPTTTTAAAISTTSTSACNCKCSDLSKLLGNYTYDPEWTNMTTEEKVEHLVTKLRVDKTKLSSFIRKKTSAPDNRVVSKSIGYLGISFISVIFGLVIVSDGINLLKYLTKKREITTAFVEPEVEDSAM